MANRVLYGLKNVHYAVWDEKEQKYGTPVAWPGAVSMTIAREGDSNDFFADDVKYWSYETNAGYTGTFESAVVDEETLKTLLGWIVDSNNMLLEDTDSIPVNFALMYEVSSNVKNQRFVFYNCTISRPEFDANTKSDTTEPDTQSVDITMTSRQFEYGAGVNKNIVKGTMTLADDGSNSTAYNAFFTAVQTPTPAQG